MRTIRRVLLLFGISALAAGGCQSRDLATAPRLSRGARVSDVVYCSTEIEPTPDCVPDSGEGSGGNFTDSSGQPSFWPSGFHVVFTHAGTGFTGDAAIVTPVGFGSTQTYNYIANDLWGNTCIGEIYMDVGEAILLQDTGYVSFSDFTMQCF